jgi:hypothetical protein
MKKVYILYINVSSNFIQNNKSYINHYIHNECFCTQSNSDNLPVLSTNKILIAFIKDVKGKIEFNNGHYSIVSFFINSFENNHCIIWDVCTPLKYRKQNYFKCIMTYFIEQFASQYTSVSLFVDPYKDNYLQLIRMYSKFGFKINSWDMYYKLTLQQLSYSPNLNTSLQIPFRFRKFYDYLVDLHKMYKEFYFHIDNQWNLTILPTEVLFQPKNFSDSFQKSVYQYKNYYYFYPFYNSYFYNQTDFIQKVDSNYFYKFFYSILQLGLKKSFQQIYSHVLNIHNKNDLTPRFFICIQLKN